jgi:hypothetical protein
MMKLFKSQRASSVVGISLAGERLEAVVVRRSGAGLRVGQTASAPMALSALTGDPDLVGREIQNHLDSAGVRERRCVVCLPLTWVLTLQTKVPEMSEADLDSYLQIEAERGFTSGHESLFITRSFFTAPNGDKYATLLAVPRNHLAVLERVLRAAKLKPQAFAMGISAVQSPSGDSGQRVLTLALSNNGLELQVSGGGGVVALRSLDAAVETEGARRTVSADLVAREIRITLGQLPGGFSEASGPIKIFGGGDAARQFVSEIAPRLSAMGLRVEPMDRPANLEFETAPAPEVAASPVLALAAGYVKSADVGPDFLPPKVTPWQQFVATKLSTQKLAYGGGAAAFAGVCVGGLFGWQQFQIIRLNHQWKPIADQVKKLTEDQDNIHTYQPWFDTSCRTLTILKNLTLAYPTTGTVNAKSIEIHDLNAVQLAGTAVNLTAFNTMRENLGQESGVVDLHSEVRVNSVSGGGGGQQPVQYTLTYHLQPEGAASDGN